MRPCPPLNPDTPFLLKPLSMSAQHPGEHLRLNYMEPLQLGVTELAEKLGVSKATVSRLLAGKTDLSAAMAVRLSLAFGREPESWMALQTAFSIEEARKLIDPATVVSLKLTKDVGWIQEVPKVPGHYEWRKSKGKPVHKFEVFHQQYGTLTDTCYRCWTLTDFDFIKRKEGEWRRVTP
jgi:addiction module HigA family antidote